MSQHNKKKFEVDTQFVYDLLVNEQSTEHVEGTGVLVYVVNNKRLRFLRFHSTNLYIAQDLSTGGLIWASTKDAVKLAATMGGITLGPEIETQPETIYEVVTTEDKGHQLMEVGKQKFAPLHQTTYTNAAGAQQFVASTGYRSGQTVSTVNYARAKCRCCGTLNTNQSEGLDLCGLCLEIATHADNSMNQQSFWWFGHYMPPEENFDTEPPAPVTRADVEAALDKMAKQNNQPSQTAIILAPSDDDDDELEPEIVYGTARRARWGIGDLWRN